MNICKIETVEVNVVERMWFDKIQVMCENIAKEANNPDLVGSAELVLDGLNNLLPYVVTKLDC